MAKTIVSMLFGIAMSEGRIRSVDDLAAAYVPALKGSEYGKTPVKDLLHIASGMTLNQSSDLADVLSWSVKNDDPTGAFRFARRPNGSKGFCTCLQKISLKTNSAMPECAAVNTIFDRIRYLTCPPAASLQPAYG